VGADGLVCGRRRGRRSKSTPIHVVRFRRDRRLGADLLRHETSCSWRTTPRPCSGCPGGSPQGRGGLPLHLPATDREGDALVWSVSFGEDSAISTSSPPLASSCSRRRVHGGRAQPHVRVTDGTHTSQGWVIIEVLTRRRTAAPRGGVRGARCRARHRRAVPALHPVLPREQRREAASAPRRLGRPRRPRRQGGQGGQGGQGDQGGQGGKPAKEGERRPPPRAARGRPEAPGRGSVGHDGRFHYLPHHGRRVAALGRAKLKLAPRPQPRSRSARRPGAAPCAAPPRRAPAGAGCGSRRARGARARARPPRPRPSRPRPRRGRAGHEAGHERAAALDLQRGLGQGSTRSRARAAPARPPSRPQSHEDVALDGPVEGQPRRSRSLSTRLNSNPWYACTNMSCRLNGNRASAPRGRRVVQQVVEHGALVAELEGRSRSAARASRVAASARLAVAASSASRGPTCVR